MPMPSSREPNPDFRSGLEQPRLTQMGAADKHMVRRLAVIFWPSFVVAGIAVGLFFTVFDPVELSLFGQPLSLSRLGAYSIGFFCFWVLAAASSALTCFFNRPAGEINRRPLADATAREADGPNREDPNTSGG